MHFLILSLILFPIMADFMPTWIIILGRPLQRLLLVPVGAGGYATIHPMAAHNITRPYVPGSLIPPQMPLR